MLIFVIVVVIVVVTVFLGIGVAMIAARMDQAVQETRQLENNDKGYNTAVTLGHKVLVDADVNTQLKQARLLAAKKAAALPRGANMGIGRLGDSNLQTASQRLEDDPMTSVKIANFHGWAGARTGYAAAVPVAEAPAAAPAATGKIVLVAGKDYPVIEITDDMSPDEKRKARIANSKAKSAAMKAAKAAREAGATPVATAAPVAAAPAAQEAAPVNVPEPPVLIEMQDDMTPDEKRKARIANAKAKSAYSKALKAAGLDPKAIKAGAGPTAPAASAPAPAAAASAPEAETPSAELANIPEPDYMEMTDDMSPDEKRKARIHNAKARSAYNKALKAAGIDPKSVKN